MKLFLLFCAIVAGLFAQPGAWEGKLNTPGGTLRVRLNLASDGSGWKATLDSLDQGANGIPVPEVALSSGKLTFRIPALNASYEGQLNAAGDTFEGTFTQGLSIKLDLKRATEPAKPPSRPQTPQPPFSYRSEDVTFPSKAPGITLAGTLAIPEGKGPHPALILISGSGPQDRDETLFAHKPFAVIADYLARRGIAVLRFDDRGIAKSTGKFADATSADFSQDAEGGLDYLLTRKELNPKRIGIGGHSEGGLIAPMIAARRPKEVAFVVMLAGPGVSGDQVLYEQGAAIARANKVSENTIAAQRTVQEAIFAAVKSGASTEDVIKVARERAGGAAGVEQSARQVTGPWFRYFLTYDPAPTLEKVKCPVLVMNGELDLQVLATQNVPAIEAAFKRSGNKRVAVHRLPKLNHLFQTATTGAVAEYAQIEETISPAALTTLGDWLRRTAKVK